MIIFPQTLYVLCKLGSDTYFISVYEIIESICFLIYFLKDYWYFLENFCWMCSLMEREHTGIPALAVFVCMSLTLLLWHGTGAITTIPKLDDGAEKMSLSFRTCLQNTLFNKETELKYGNFSLPYFLHNLAFHEFTSEVDNTHEIKYLKENVFSD